MSYTVTRNGHVRGDDISCSPRTDLTGVRRDGLGTRDLVHRVGHDVGFCADGTDKWPTSEQLEVTLLERVAKHGDVVQLRIDQVDPIGIYRPSGQG